jgi:hypothetical protein
MTNATSRYVPPGEKRRIIEDAYLAFRPDVADRYPRPEAPGPPEAQQALADLAAATNIPRLVKHRRLIDGLRLSSAEDRAGFDDQARDVFASTLEQGLPDDTRQNQADLAKRRQDEAAAASDERRLQPRHSQLMQSTNDIFRFTTHEQTFEACNDEQKAMKATPDGQFFLSRLIIAQFWSNLPPAAFRTYVDPRNWPQCSPFWRAMQPLGPIVQTADGYDGDFAETVNIITETLTVPLHIGFRVLPDQSRVWTRFNISRAFYDQFPDIEVDVDTGTVSAESVPGGPAPTRVRATKYLHWRDPDRSDLTGLSCDLGWSDLMMEMADGCAQGSPADGGQAQSTVTGGTKTSADAAVSQLVEAVTTQCQQGISESGPYFEQLIGRFTGSSWDAGWINDMLGMGLVTARRYGNVASNVRRFADSLRDTATERDGHG